MNSKRIPVQYHKAALSPEPLSVCAQLVRNVQTWSSTRKFGNSNISGCFSRRRRREGSEPHVRFQGSHIAHRIVNLRHWLAPPWRAGVSVWTQQGIRQPWYRNFAFVHIVACGASLQCRSTYTRDAR
jgi:hypothetical protein